MVYFCSIALLPIRYMWQWLVRKIIYPAAKYPEVMTFIAIDSNKGPIDFVTKKKTKKVHNE
ncbi:hypothetical protein CXF71_03900 [Colwellia sp. 12G3]|nr:hypothetical protein CXF71_03900 [Colwellia sp. 12G3]